MFIEFGTAYQPQISSEGFADCRLLNQNMKRVQVFSVKHTDHFAFNS